MDESAATERTMAVLCKATDIPENGMLRMVIAGYPPLAVFNLEGGYYALDDRCSHGQASLAAGTIEGGTVVCPLHFGSFDIRTGEPVDPPCTRDVATYPLTLRAGELLISSVRKL